MDPTLLPELIVTLSGGRTHHPHVQPAYPDSSEFGALDEIVNLPHSGNPAPEVQVPNDAATWQFTDCSLNGRRSRHLSHGLLDDLPDLSHTPLSCHSDTSNINLPFNPEPDFTSCLSGSDVLGTTRAAEDWMDHYDPLMFPLSSLSCTHTASDPLSIHSPKPLFAYNTLQFDLDSSGSPAINEQESSPAKYPMCRKRHIDDEDELGDACQRKKRKLVHDHPRLVPLISGTHSDLVTAYRPHNTSDATCSETHVFAMDELQDIMYSWNTGAWSNFSEY